MIRLLAAAFAALSISACSTYVPVPYESDIENVETIALIEDVGKAEVRAFEVASAGSNFGLIGALVDAGIQESRRQALLELLNAENFNGQAYFRESLKRSLEARGYTVEIVDLGERDGLKLIGEYPQGETGADAYLDAVLRGWGVMSSGVGTPFRPVAGGEAVLVEPGTNRIMMKNAINIGGTYTPQGQISLSPPPVEFANRDDLLADPTHTVDAIKQAIDLMADTFAGLLEK